MWGFIAALNNGVGIAAALNNCATGPVGHGDGNDETDDADPDQNVADQDLVEEGG